MAKPFDIEVYIKEQAEQSNRTAMKLETARNHSEPAIDPASLRGSLVLAKPIAYALVNIDSLPRARQEWSDRQDMANMLLHALPEFAASAAVTAVEHHTETAVDVMDHKFDPEDE